MDYSTLSYTVKKKTNKVCELKEQRDRKRNLLKIPVIAIALLCIYVGFNINRYSSYVMAFLQNHSTESILKRFDPIIFGIFFVTIIITLILFDEYKTTKRGYDDLRKDLIKTINNEFCICSNDCKCKDDYIKDMEKKGVDLIF
ncbi:Uncharacterised protein [Clostridium putrefaciens]|uniref:Uncharacterized protein n=1 Tax=Clostridium putrefaciens TaxID=99675 RepID=A0A381J5I1_9CLOT|nr:hypothetical protein [Clostridium putrefaciens]SUY46564.1 Uncharacterised protein [Clostridium putrefaciens]